MKKRSQSALTVLHVNEEHERHVTNTMLSWKGGDYCSVTDTDSLFAPAAVVSA